MSRWILAILILLLVLWAAARARQAHAAECRTALVTAFSAEEFDGLTFDETPTGPNVGRIVAAGRAYELGQTVWIEGLGHRRVADRGHLGTYQIDLLVETHAEAVSWGHQTLTVCG